MDYALLCAGSSFTVGVAEEEHDIALTHVMADAPEHDRKMAATTMHHQSHNMPTEPESAHVMPAKPGPARIMSATPESPAKMATKPADAPLWPGLIACVLNAPLVSVRAADIPRSALSTPSQELAESVPEPAPSQELAESAPEAAPSRELAESAPEAAPSRELAESPPECPLEVVEPPRDFLGGSFPPLLTEAPNPAMAHGVP